MNKYFTLTVLSIFAAVFAAILLIDRVALVGIIIRTLVEIRHDFWANAATYPLPAALAANYDFIVVGAGTAGCVIANRLSENPDWRVLLLEAGREETIVMDVPMFVTMLQQSDTINWNYKSEPSETECLSMIDRRCRLPRGRVMGGSSVLNYMIYTRGSRSDFDRWESAGNAGWNFQSVRPYFERAENDTTERPVLGRDGPVSISNVKYRSELGSAFVEAAIEMGLPHRNYNGERLAGVSYIQSTTHNGYRVSSNRAYVDPVRRVRSNLHVLSGSHVTRILMKNGRAVGVEFMDSMQQKRQALASREVILSAGAIGSPQLLMVSGIGPKSELDRHEIAMIHELPGVGENLMDHVSPGIFQFAINATAIPIVEIQDAGPWLQYFRDGTGMLGLPGGCESIAFFNSSNFRQTDVGEADLEFLQISGGVHEAPEVRLNLGLTTKDYEQLYGQLNGRHTVGVAMFVLRPKSRGHIRLSSASAQTPPSISMNYYSDADDMATVLRGIRKLEEMEKTEAFKRLNATMDRSIPPGCEPYSYGSDEYWQCYVRHLTYTIYHYSGTCKMGPATDKFAVVDERLRVHGVRGLRVADASIMPEIISGHPNAAVFMIGEKVSAMIKDDNK